MQLAVGRSRPDEGAERHPVPQRRNGAADSGRRTDEGTMGHIASDGGSIKHNGQAAAARALAAARATGEILLHATACAVARRPADAREPSHSPAGGGIHRKPLPPSRRNRACGQRRRRRAAAAAFRTAARIASRATRSSLLRLRLTRAYRDNGSPITTELITPPPGRLARPRRAGQWRNAAAISRS